MTLDDAPVMRGTRPQLQRPGFFTRNGTNTNPFTQPDPQQETPFVGPPTTRTITAGWTGGPFRTGRPGEDIGSKGKLFSFHVDDEELSRLVSERLLCGSIQQFPSNEAIKLLSLFSASHENYREEIAAPSSPVPSSPPLVLAPWQTPRLAARPPASSTPPSSVASAAPVKTWYGHYASIAPKPTYAVRMIPVADDTIARQELRGFRASSHAEVAAGKCNHNQWTPDPSDAYDHLKYHKSQDGKAGYRKRKRRTQIDLHKGAALQFGYDVANRGFLTGNGVVRDHKIVRKRMREEGPAEDDVARAVKKFCSDIWRLRMEKAGAQVK